MFGRTNKPEKKVEELEKKVAGLEQTNNKMLNMININMLGMIEKNTDSIKTISGMIEKNTNSIKTISGMIEKNTNSINTISDLVNKLMTNITGHFSKQGGKKKTKKLKGRITRKGKTMKRRIIV